MAGTLTVSYQQVRTIQKITLDWLSDATGVVSGTATKRLTGSLLRVVFIPDSGGTQPSDLYDVVLNDDNGLNVLAGQGANLSNATASNVVPGVPLKDGTTTSISVCILDDTLTLGITNAGAAKGGNVVLYLG